MQTKQTTRKVEQAERTANIACLRSEAALLRAEGNAAKRQGDLALWQECHLEADDFESLAETLENFAWLESTNP
jgi:hypothetical protein